MIPALFTLGPLTLWRREVSAYSLPEGYGYAEMKRIAGIPALQSVADPGRTGSLALALHEALDDVDRRIAALRELARAKQASLLVYVPAGAPVGWFAIRRLDVRGLQFGRDGALRAASVGVDLREIPRDRLAAPIIPPAIAARRSGREIAPPPRPRQDYEGALR